MFVKELALIGVLACGLTAAAAVPASANDLKNYSFEQYVKDFHLNYTPSEVEKRRALFSDELERVVRHNSENKSWKAGINKFSAMTPEEKKASLGVSKGVARNHKPQNLKSLPEDIHFKDIRDLPDHVDWREAGIASPVKDQGHCGSCWAFASTAVIESHVAKATGLLFDLSVEQMAMCTPNPDSCGGTGGCMGATTDVAFEYVTESGGLLQEYQYSYTSYYGENFECTMPASEAPKATINGYAKVPSNNYTAMMNVVATVGPVAISLDASTWHNYESGIYNGCNQENPDVDHGVVLMGYGTDEETGEKYWLIRNSWSPTYGEKGYIRIARTDFEEDNCGTDITPEDGIACEGDHEPVRACGTCAVLFDGGYPLNAQLV